MLFLLSPAKTLDYEPAPSSLAHTSPLFAKQSAKLIGVLKKKSEREIAELMDLSPALSALNAQRYKAWKPTASLDNAKQAVLAFNGDVYDGLDANSLDAKALDWLQAHLCILSGLYGVLRPLDLMQAYRLEMGTSLTTPQGSNLYQFWGHDLADYLKSRLADMKDPVVVNLASQEYFKAVDLRALDARVVECVFEDFKSGKYKIISFFAKKARGLMMRYAALKRCTRPKDLESFNLDGYAFSQAASSEDRLVFRRKQAA